MNRTLALLAVITVLVAVAAARVKVSIDTTSIQADQQSEPGQAPPPLAPSGLDGRPLDPNIAVTQPHTPPARQGPP